MSYYIISSGVVSVSGSIDFEEFDALLVTILATDGGTPPLSSACLLNITVLDVNDNAPAFLQQKYSATVSEGVPIGTQVAKVS